MAMDGNEDMDMDSRWTKVRWQGRRMSGSGTAERRHDCRDASVLGTGPYHDREDDYRLQSKLTGISFRRSGQRKSRANNMNPESQTNSFRGSCCNT